MPLVVIWNFKVTSTLSVSVNVIDKLYYRKRMMKPLAIALSVTERRVKRGDRGGDLITVQCKLIQNCHNEPHPGTTNIS
jgi:hypothetical protein